MEARIHGAPRKLHQDAPARDEGRDGPTNGGCGARHVVMVQGERRTHGLTQEGAGRLGDADA